MLIKGSPQREYCSLSFLTWRHKEPLIGFRPSPPGYSCFNTRTINRLRSEPNECHFADDNFKCIIIRNNFCTQIITEYCPWGLANTLIFGLGNGFPANMWLTITWTNGGLFHSRMRASTCLHGLTLMQRSFWVRDQPMRKGVTMQRLFSLTEPIPRIIPANSNSVRNKDL